MPKYASSVYEGALIREYYDEVKDHDVIFIGDCEVYENISDWEGQSMPDYDSPECVTARAAFDAKLTAKGGKAIGSSGNPFAEWYLSSTRLRLLTLYRISACRPRLYGCIPRFAACRISWTAR